MMRSGLLKERKTQVEGGLSRFTTTTKLVHKGSSHTLRAGNVLISFHSVSDVGKLLIFSNKWHEQSTKSEK